MIGMLIGDCGLLYYLRVLALVNYTLVALCLFILGLFPGDVIKEGVLLSIFGFWKIFCPSYDPSCAIFSSFNFWSFIQYNIS